MGTEPIVVASTSAINNPTHKMGNTMTARFHRRREADSSARAAFFWLKAAACSLPANVCNKGVGCSALSVGLVVCMLVSFGESGAVVWLRYKQWWRQDTERFIRRCVQYRIFPRRGWGRGLLP